MANDLDKFTTKHLVPFVIFRWGRHDDHLSHFVRFENDVDLNGTTYAACPELDVDTDKMQAGTADSMFRIRLRIDRYPIYYLLRPFPFATVRVTVGEVDPYNVANTYREMLKGQIQMSTRNKNGSAMLVELTCVGIRERYNYPLGLACTSLCSHVFGDEGCRINLAPLIQTGLVTSITNRDIIVTGLTSPRANYFKWGQIFYDALSIQIVRQVTDYHFRLSKPAPPEWAGQSPNVTPGCGKDLPDCQAWNNEPRFLALGRNMPAYHPQVSAV